MITHIQYVALYSTHIINSTSVILITITKSNDIVCKTTQADSQLIVQTVV